MYSKVMLMLVLMSVFIAPSNLSAQAQESASALIIWQNGDYYRYQISSTEVTQLTTWGCNYRPVMSPDNIHIAYASLATMGFEAFEGCALGDGLSPINIWVLNTETKESFRPADQGLDASMKIGIMTTRNEPVWSPTGDALAWIEMDSPSKRYSLAIYDIISQETIRTTLLLSINELPGIPSMPQLRWGQSGIAVSDFDGNVRHLSLYSSVGELLTIFPVYMTHPFIDFQWITSGELEYLGIAQGDGTWLFFALTGELTTCNCVIEMFQPNRSDATVIRLSFAIDEANTDLTKFLGTSIKVNGDSNILGEGYLNHFFITTNGAKAGYLNNGVMSVENIPLNLSNVRGVSASYTHYRTPTVIN